MSQKPPGCIDVLYAVESMPGDHNRDFPVVAPLGWEDWGHDRPYPFASIIMVEPNQIMATKPHQAIQVTSDGNGLSYSEGVFAISDRYPLIVAKEPLPELLIFLRRMKKSLRPLQTVKKHQKPWIHVKNWHQQDIVFEPKHKRLDAADAYEVIHRWGGWERTKKSWRDRMNEMSRDFNYEDLDSRDRAENGFQKFCNDMGLNDGDGKDFQKPLEVLHTAIAIAREVANRSRS